MYRTVLAAVTLALVITACGNDTGTQDGAEPTDSPSAAAPPAVTPPTDGPTDPPADPPEEEDAVSDREGPVAEAIADLAQETGVDPADIEVVAHEQVTWRNGAMGCPQPDMMYTQALVDGYRIVLRAAGQEITYHGAMGRSPFRCDNPDPNGAVDDRS